jgi:ubiquinol-cytochrome c reductase cytochrome b subunit
MNQFLDWLDHRTGIRAFTHAALFEHIPGGARWRYVWGSTLSFCFFVQVVTGFVLWAAYSPSAQTAWESVFYIQNQMTGGWLLRGVHHFTAQMMVVLMVVHFVQVVIDGAYRAPREINFWLGLILLQIVLGLALTGYLLPWDQKGYWATSVATGMISLVPLVGAPLQRLIVGGADYGHHTLTRFFALHAGVLPALLAIFLTLHVLLFRRHGLTVRDPKRAPDTTFWPEQLLRDAVACLGVAIVVLALVVWNLPNVEPGVPVTHQIGAELGAPANPAEAYSAARPEVYFLFLYQLLKYMNPFVGAIIVPGLVMLTLFAMPIVGRWDLGHRFNVVWTFALLAGAGFLTAVAWHHDHNGNTEESKHYLAAVADAEAQAERAVLLASAPTGIPPTGALTLLRSDAKTQGPKLFREHCAACHDHAPPEGSTADVSQDIRAEKATASNLWGFGTTEWVRGILDPAQIAGPHFFGNTKFKDGEMVKFVKETIGDKITELKDKPEELAKYRQSLEDVVIAIETEGGRTSDQVAELNKRADAGRKAIVDVFACIDCHKFREEGGLGSAPDLTGYASREWLTAFISDPTAERFYPDTNDNMPAFAPHPGDPANRLTAEELATLVAWLRSDWYEPPAASNTPAK